MDRSLKTTDNDTKKKEDRIAIKSIDDEIKQCITNIASYMKKRNKEESLSKSTQEERSKTLQEVVNMKGQLRYDSVQMPCIENNLRQIDGKKNIIIDYTTKITTTFPICSAASVKIRDQLLQWKNHIDGFVNKLEAKHQNTEKELALVEERLRVVKLKLNEALECLNSNGLNMTTNLQRLQRDKCDLQKNLKQVKNEVVMQKIEKVKEKKVLLNQQMQDKKQRRYKLLQEVDQQKVVFGRAQLERVENMTKLLEEIQLAESELKKLQLEAAKKESATVNMLKELEIKEMENSNLKLRNDELAITQKQAGSNMEGNSKTIELEFSSQVEEHEKSKTALNELAAILNNFEKKLVLEKQAKQEIDLKLEDIKEKIQKLKVECEQLKIYIQEYSEKIERFMEELSITQEADINLNEELSKLKENEDIQSETKIKEIELEIENMKKKSDEAIAQIIKENNRMVIEFNEQTGSEMKSFDKLSREIEGKIRILRENLDDVNLAKKDLEEGVIEKQEEMDELLRAKSLLTFAKTSTPIPPQRGRKQIVSCLQAPKAITRSSARYKEAASYSLPLKDNATRSTRFKKVTSHSLTSCKEDVGRSTGLNEAVSYFPSPKVVSSRSIWSQKVDVSSFSVTSPSNKRKEFDEMSNSSSDGYSYDFTAFAALRDKQIHQSNLANKKK